MGLSTCDRAALTAAVAAARAQDEGRREQIDDFLRDRTRTWQDTAEFAAYSCQMTTLGLRPWQTPPCWIEPADINKYLTDASSDKSGEREAAELLQRMLRLGVSRFDPDPLHAIAAAEAARKPAA